VFYGTDETKYKHVGIYIRFQYKICVQLSLVISEIYIVTLLKYWFIERLSKHV